VLIPRYAPIAFLIIIVMTAACGTAGEPTVDSATAAASVEAAADPTPELTPAPTPEPAASAETAANCMDPEIYAVLTDRARGDSVLPPEEAARLAAALRAYDFTDQVQPAQDAVARQIEALEDRNFLDLNFGVHVQTGEVLIVTCQ
jgi:hypothetical protein